MWSFTPTDHPAHPSAVRRQVTFTSQGPLMDTKVLCEASTEQCRAFAAELRDVQQQLSREPQLNGPR